MSAALSTAPSAARHRGRKGLLFGGELHQIDELVHERPCRRSSALLECATNLGGALDGALSTIQQLLDWNELACRLRTGVSRLEGAHRRKTRVQDILELLPTRWCLASWRRLSAGRRGGGGGSGGNLS